MKDCLFLTTALVMLAYTKWTSIGNSNWFMFVTFALYLLVFISFKLFNKNQLRGLICFSILSIGLTITLFFLKESWWWNTLLCFPLGMWYGFFKERIDKYTDNIYIYIYTDIYNLRFCGAKVYL